MRKLRLLENGVEDIDIAETEWRRITSIAIPTLAGISTVQAFFAEPLLQAWQLQLFLGNLLLALTGFFLEKRYQSNFSFLPLYLYMLASPVLLGDQPLNSWMSIGLVCMAANIHIAGIQRVKPAVISVLAITAYQSWVAFQNFPSVSDNSDVQYFYSYFAATWMLAIGFGTIFIRRRYLKVAHNVREIVEDSLDDSLGSLSAIKRANLEDSNNIQLHGTVLNTLIYFKNLPAKTHTPEEIKKIITNDLSLLKSRSITTENDGLRGEIVQLLATRSRHRIEVLLGETPRLIEDKELDQGIVEILREVLLNLEKHTNATSCTINIYRKNPSHVLVSIEANSVQDLNSQQIESEILASKASLSLNKLVTSFGGEFEVSPKPKSGQLLYEISMPERSVKNTLQETLGAVRYAGLNDFAINFTRVSAIVGLLHLIGFAAIGMELNHLILIALFNLTLLAAIETPKSKVLLIISSVLSFLVIPFLVDGVQECENLLTLPWVFNTVLTQGFLVALRVRSHGLKWLPLLVLAVQSLVYPQGFDVACRSIFAGSVPAIPLIAVLAFTVLRIREREFGVDLEQTRSIAKINDSSEKIESDVNREYESLVQELDSFALNQDFSLPSDEIKQEYEIQIQKIRNYLICAEQFQSLFVRHLYYFTKSRINRGLLTRLTLHGSLSMEAEGGAEIGSLFEYLAREFEGLQMDLTVIASNSVEIVVGVSGIHSPLQPVEFGSIQLRFEATPKP